MMDRLSELKFEGKELQEAIFAGENASRDLLAMMKSLRSAKGWGLWDLLGGGLISGLMKHSRIDEANNLSRKVERSLSLFQKELSDINQFTNIRVDIGSFAKFADFFFDGLFADMFVQSKIKETLSNVEATHDRVSIILSQLRTRLSHVQDEIQRLR